MSSDFARCLKTNRAGAASAAARLTMWPTTAGIQPVSPRIQRPATRLCGTTTNEPLRPSVSDRSVPKTSVTTCQSRSVLRSRYSPIADGVALDDGGVVGTVALGRSRPRGIRPVEAGTDGGEVVDVDALGGQSPRAPR